MNQDQNFEVLSPEAVPETAARLKSEGYRMVQICAITMEGASELVYSFDKDQKLLNLKVTVPFGTPVKSITPSYWAAFVYENEIHDLFDVEFTDSELDYKGNFFRVSTKTPWKGPEAKGAE
ncbi:MAG: NADH-quinone oxidoreductase subunit C [Thermoplasmata archaeon]|nr:NADH-quinone oxidoreductase subunit C [Thermoplasmata archaeon]